MSKDKRTYQKRRRDAQRDENGKSIYEKVMSGEIEPKGCQKGWKNLQPIPFNKMDEKTAREIRSKGGKAVQEIRGEKKSAKQVLDNLLTLKATDAIIDGSDLQPELVERLKRGTKNATLYDVMGAVALGKALDGNVKAMEYIRDTYGDKPSDKVQIDGNNLITDQDRNLLAQIAKRLEDKEILVVQDVSDSDN